MSEETEKVETVEDNEPIYYKPRSLNLVASTSGVLSLALSLSWALTLPLARGLPAALAVALRSGLAGLGQGLSHSGSS